MVKLKQGHNRSGPAKKNQNQGSPKVDPPDEEDWIFVKKQRVTIIIPPLPNKKNSTTPSVELGECHLQEKPRTTDNSQSPRKTSSQLQCPLVISAAKQSVNEPEKSVSFPEPAIQPPIVEHPSEPNLIIRNPSSPSHRIASDNSPLHSHREINNCIGVSRPSKGNQRMKMFVDSSSVLLNQRMRMWYLEKKLKKAGGLENWLVSLGLARFVKIFQMKSVSKFQLANFTMQKLKDMGTDAVGPRRKLMHAIDCLCEPHCFQNV
ncbi:hypothetical protein ACS0TY_015717 [Phlomoides rotata]